MNEYVVWHDDYSVGLEQIDAHHRLILRIINNVYAAMRTGDADGTVKKFLGDLKTYTVIHFHFEESIIRAAGYPGDLLDEHCAVHRKMTAKTTALVTDWEHERTLPQEALDFLKQWWITHIRKKDMEYAPWVRENREMFEGVTAEGI